MTGDLETSAEKPKFAKMVSQSSTTQKPVPGLLRLLVAVLVLASLPTSVTGTSTSLSWGITVYVKADTAGMRAVSAAQGTYIYEGTITYAWKDTSLSAFPASSGSVTKQPSGCTGATSYSYTYPATPIDNSNYDKKVGCFSDYTALSSGCSITPTTCSVDPPGPYPLVVPDINKQTAASKNTITWEVQYGTPTHMVNTAGFSASDTTTTWVVGVQKVSVTIANAQDLHDFPVDTQTLNFGLTNTFLPTEAMAFKFIDDEKSFITSTAGNPDNDAYVILDSTYTIYTDDAGNSGFKLQYKVKRNPDLYFIRFILPLTIITTIVLAWMLAPPGNGSRTNGPFTIIATTTSFIFIASNSVPLIPYRTRLDNYFVFQFLLAACVGIWNIYSANRMDRFKSAYTKGLQAAAKQREEKSKKQNELSSKMNASLPATADKLPAGSDEVALQLEVSAYKDSEAPKPKPEDIEPSEEVARLLWQLLKFHKNQEKTAADKAAASSKTDTMVNEAHYMSDIIVGGLFVGSYVILVACLFAAPTPEQ